MNITIADSWLREHLETNATPKEIKDALSLCGPSVERTKVAGNDTIYEIEVTSNRVDTACVYGIAQEAAAILPRFGFLAKLKPRATEEIPTAAAALALSIEDPNQVCERLLGIVMDTIIVRPSEETIRDRIEKSGVRSLSNIIDITNYLMLEYGHPCHVFDYDRIGTHRLVLRRAKKGETITTLDGKTHTLVPDDVVIDDGTGRIIDLPGIMGAMNSVVHEKTKRVVLFIESNNPISIRKTSMRLGLRTLAATINEKQPDPERAFVVMKHAVSLYQKHAGGTVAGKLFDSYPRPAAPKSISITGDFVRARLGITLSTTEMKTILKTLGFSAQATETDTLIVTPPTFRHIDVRIPEDIVEEIARIYGYHNLPNQLMSGEIPIQAPDPMLLLEEKIKTMLKYWGYTETYHYSFVGKALLEQCGLSVSDHLRVANPLTADIEYMRMSLLPSLLTTLAANQHIRQNLALFELSHIYQKQKNALPHEIPMLAIVSQTDFVSMKGLVSALCKECMCQTTEVPVVKDRFFHPKQSIQLVGKGGATVATVGALHPHIMTAFAIKRTPFIAYLSLPALQKAQGARMSYQPISVYPPVYEDLTVLTSPKTTFGTIKEIILTATPRVTDIALIDSYTNTLTLRITYHDVKQNLDSGEIAQLRQAIVSALTKSGYAVKGMESATVSVTRPQS